MPKLPTDDDRSPHGDQPGSDDADLFTDDLLLLLALMRNDENDEAVYGWLAEEYEERAETG